MWYALLAGVTYAAGIIHLKWLLRESQLESRTFLPLHFLLLFTIASLTTPFLGRLDASFFEARYLVLFGIIIVVGVVWNWFWTNGFRRDSIHDYEIIELLLPVFTIVLAALVFFDEREPIRLALASLAAGTFLVAHLHHRHISIKQADRWLVYAVFLMAAEIILMKPLLFLMNPATLYALRTGVIALVLIFVLRPRLSRVSSFVWSQMVVNSLFFVANRILVLTAISHVGIVVTELFLLIGPFLIALSAHLILRESWPWRAAVAFIVIFGAIFAMSYLAL